MNENNNVYFRARKEAAICNGMLYSRERAAELLGISASTLACYERGITKVVPVENVVLMAGLYNAPELVAWYCKHECPVHGFLPLATQAAGIEGVTLRLLKEFDPEKIRQIGKSLIDIAADGTISEDEKPQLEIIMKRLDELAIAISEMKLVGEKALKG